MSDQIQNISDSDEENLFVPKFSKRRVANSSKKFIKNRQTIGHKKLQTEENNANFISNNKEEECCDQTGEAFCEIDLNSNSFDSFKNKEETNGNSRKSSWRSTVTSKWFSNNERGNFEKRISSNDAEPKRSPTYLPPFEMVGQITSQNVGYTSIPKQMNKHKSGANSKKMLKNVSLSLLNDLFP